MSERIPGWYWIWWINNPEPEPARYFPGSRSSLPYWKVHGTGGSRADTAFYRIGPRIVPPGEPDEATTPPAPLRKPAASDLRERAKKIAGAIIGDWCNEHGGSGPDYDPNLDLLEAAFVRRMEREFAAIHTDAQAEVEAAHEQAAHDAYCVGQSVGWDAAVKALHSRGTDDNDADYWAAVLEADRPSPTGREN